MEKVGTLWDFSGFPVVFFAQLALSAQWPSFEKEPTVSGL